MIDEPKLGPAMKALNGVLIVLRKMAAEKQPHERLFAALDVAEVLPTLVAREGDLTQEFRRTLSGLVEQFPEMTFVLQRFDEERPREE